MARSNGSQTQKIAYKCIDDALRKDREDTQKDAYISYLKSIVAIAEALLEDAKNQTFPSNSLAAGKLMGLAKQCLERAEELGSQLEVRKIEPSAIKYNAPSYTNVNNNTINTSKILPLFETDILPAITKPGEMTNNDQSSLLDLSVVSLDAIPPSAMDLYSARPREPSPMEQVQKENLQLMAAYQARMDRSATPGARMNLQLALQRRMAENVRLAQAKEDVLRRRLTEKKKRVLEQAARKIGNSTIQNSSIKDEEATKQLYARILEYEQDEKWTGELKAKLFQNSSDSTICDSVIKQTLSVPSHPLCKLLQGMQYKIYDEIINVIARSSLTLESVEVPYVDEDSDRCGSSSITVGKGKVETSTSLEGDSSMSDELPNLIENLEAECAATVDNNIQAFADIVRISAANVEEAIEMNEEFAMNAKEQKKLHDKLLKMHRKSLGKVQLPLEALSDKQEELDCDSQNECATYIRCMEQEALKRHLQNVVFDVRISLDKLVQLLMLTYEQLNSPEGHDQCWVSIGEVFFKPLWPYLIKLIRLANRAEEITIAQVMTQQIDASLKDLGVSVNYWGNQLLPYEEAIGQLKSIINHCCPLKKLEVLVQVAHLACQDSSTSTALKSVGADDLIPILCYIVLRTRTPQIFSECYAIEQFIHEGYHMGEGGYCLTSLQTVFQYLKSQLH